MKRSPLNLETISEWDNLVTAAWLAASGKRPRAQVRDFLAHFPENLNTLRREILEGTVECGRSRRFENRAPQLRMITAPCFRERVLHHALMIHAGPVMETSLVAETFACIRGRGTLAAVRRCRQHVQRFPWYVKMDVRQYFSNIDHAVLKEMLRRRFKNQKVLALMDRIIDSHSDGSGRGLPIGTLTSQSFANFYLGRLDRFLLEHLRVEGMVRYMDDFIFWTRTRQNAKESITQVAGFLKSELCLMLRGESAINRSRCGVTLCGYRIHAETVLLGPTRRKRFLAARRRWERSWTSGEISERELQRGMDAVMGMTSGADSPAWLRKSARIVVKHEWYDDV